MLEMTSQFYNLTGTRPAFLSCYSTARPLFNKAGLSIHVGYLFKWVRLFCGIFASWEA